MIKSVFRFALDKIPRPWLIRISYLVGPVLAWYLKGDNFEDPIDGRKYKKLLPYGYHKQRLNALAPGSLSLERHRLLWLYLKDSTSLFRPTTTKKMLHVAPEQCFLKRFRRVASLDYITGDLDSPIADVQMDLHRIPFESETFDIVLCNHVLEHVEDDRKCMREIYRVLKQNGWAIMQVPLKTDVAKTDEDPTITDPEERQRRFGQYDHVRAYGRDYVDRLIAAGFEVEKIDIKQYLEKEEFRKYALPKHEMLYVCKK